MAIALIAIFFAGIANFAMHRAMIESDDPLVLAVMRPFQTKLGPNATYALEYLFLVAGLAMTTRNWLAGLVIYGVYTALNVAAFAMMRNRPD